MSDRGIKKFAPFKSLKGQYEILDEMKYQKNKIIKPTLDENQIEKIESYLCSLKEDINQVVDISYFYDGYIKYIKGTAKKLTDSYLIIEDKKDVRINLLDILDIDII